MYRIARSVLSAFGRYVRRRPGGGPVGPLLRNCRILHVDYYDCRKYYVTECFTYLAGRALTELHLHCDVDSSEAPSSQDILDLSRVMQLVPATSPDLRVLIIRDPRQNPSHEQCKGLSVLLGKLKDVRQFMTCMSLDKMDISYLAAMPNLTQLSLALYSELEESPFRTLDLSTDPVPFRALETLTLDVKYPDFATGLISLLGSQRLQKLRLTSMMWQEESTMERCLAAIATQPYIRDLAIYVTQPPTSAFATPPRVESPVSSHGLMKLLALSQMQTFVLVAHDNARFETDLDDRMLTAMASAWPYLRSLTIVQGTWGPRGVTLPHARTTMSSLLALRDNCPHLSGLSISLDTTELNDKNVLHAAATNLGDVGTALIKLNIGSRSTPVSNHSVCAQVLEGLFPNLEEIHDGTSVSWDHESSDWQEVGTILRRMKSSREADLTMFDCDDEQTYE
jgi:hypothetical protein